MNMVKGTTFNKLNGKTDASVEGLDTKRAGVF